MKNLLSILLITVFLSAQYARQFAYLQCRLIATSTQDCGCGQVSDIGKLGEDGHPLSKNHTHLSLDEFFAQPAPLAQPTIVPIAADMPQTLYQPDICTGCHMAIDRPPPVA